MSAMVVTQVIEYEYNPQGSIMKQTTTTTTKVEDDESAADQ